MLNRKFSASKSPTFHILIVVKHLDKPLNIVIDDREIVPLNEFELGWRFEKTHSPDISESEKKQIQPVSEMESKRLNKVIAFFEQEYNLREKFTQTDWIIANTESDEKIEEAKAAFSNKVYSSAIYEAYRAMVNSAKAILLSENINTNTQAGIIKQFDELFVETKKIDIGTPFSDIIYQIKVCPPSKDFANNYINAAEQFLKYVKVFRALQVAIKS